ncbi:MAG: putative lipid II flippase FtsW [Anaerosomatales bacterium]|nr:putative lipid II flippase FtsW [Anaerosomatales bacterium]
MKRHASAVRTGKRLVLISVLALSAFGLVMVYSAASVRDYQVFGNSAYHLVRQAQWLLVGLCIMALAARLDLRLSDRRLPAHRDAAMVGWAVWGFSVAGLLAVAVSGVERYGATRWLQVGPFSLQPSEFAKLGCVMVTALMLTRWKRGALTGSELAASLVMTSLPVLALVLLQPDMGTAVSIAVGVFALLVLGGVDARALVGLAGTGAALGVVLATSADYRYERVLTYLDPWRDPSGAGYQIIQSLLAFGSGGVGGVGLGLSRQKFFYLPMAHTDFIFAIVGEELGLIGAFCVVAAFAVFLVGGFMVAIGTRNEYDRLLAGGLTTLVGSQAVINMCAVTGLLPVTGIPLPFVSYGGSSLMFTLGCVGLVLGVARRAERSPEAVRSSARTARRAAGSRAATHPMTMKGQLREIPVERRRDRGARLSRAGGRAHPRAGRA